MDADSIVGFTPATDEVERVIAEVYLSYWLSRN